MSALEQRKRPVRRKHSASARTRPPGRTADRAPAQGGLLLSVFLVVALPALATGQSAVQDLSSWTQQGEVTVSEDGSWARFDSGVLLAGDGVEPFRDGAIEAEVQLTGHRAFVYARFRDAGDGNWEEIYLRAHKSDLPDALQYTPVISFSSQWQIFHGPGGTAPIPLDPERWTRLRLEFSDSGLVVFWGDGADPALVVPRLALAPRAGRVALRGFIPRGSAAPFAARMRNVRVEPGAPLSAGSRAALAAARADRPEQTGAVLSDGWMVGPRFLTETKTATVLPTVTEWTPIQTEPDGKLLLHRLGSDRGINAVVARQVIDADRGELRALDLGYSDAVTVFLNGRPLAALDQSYRFDAPRVQGVMGFHQARLFLPLEAGRNELHFLVTDSFGGWGLMARWVDAPD